MHPLFSISADDIQSLNDRQARELIARLCRAEIRAAGGSEASVTWGGDQRAADGGIDVRVESNLDLSTDGYIPQSVTCFQVKAEPFPPSKITEEMMPSGTIRQSIEELAQSGGAYIIVSTQDRTSDHWLKERLSAIKNCITKAGLNDTFTTNFYDSRRIADWIEQHPGVLVWTRTQVGKPLVGWQSYGPWGFRESDVHSEYLFDDTVRVFAPDNEKSISTIDALDRVRGDLQKRPCSIRIIGLSGVGKTRLVQAIFDERIQTSNSLPLSENVLYTDLSDHPSPQPNALVQGLLTEGAETTVVVDNCSPDVHERLTTIIKGAKSRLGLITLEYDVRDDLPEGTICYRLEPSSSDLIGKILARRYPAFSRPELERIAEFSGGNARVAFALADRCADGGDLVQLNDTELFERLFFQTDTPNRQLLGGGEVCSLLYSFESTDLGPDSEMALLGSLADLSVLGLAREVGELKHRGLVQQRGRWKAVLPHAIANRLAARALKLYPTDFLVQKLVTEATGRVAVSFARRLGFLHETVQAKEIVSTLLHEDGQLADLPSLNDVGRSVFKNVAPVNQRETLNALLKATLSPQFIDAGNYTRSTFIEVARCLAYEPDLFDEAVLCLLRFTAGEETGRKQNSTVDVLKSLFYCHLSGTLAPPNQREKIVNRLLSGSENESRIGLSLLAAGLEAGHFTSIHSTEFGGRSRSYGWWPRTRDQYREWYTSFIAIAREHGTRSGPIRAEVRHIFADALRGLWTSGCLDEELTAAAEEWSESEAWPEGWLALRRIQRWDKERVSSESLARLVELETKLSPKDLEARIRARVMTRGSSALDIYDDDEGGSNPSNIGTRYQETQLDAEQLGELAAGDRDLLGRLAPSLLLERGSAEAFSFGRGIGRASGDPQLLLKDLRLAVRSADKTQVGLNVVRGILHAWHSHDPSAVDAFLDDALCDEVWGYFFPELQLQISLGQKDVDRLLRSLELNIAPEWQFQYLGMGRATDPLSVVQIFDLVRGIASRNSGISVAIDILGMVIHCASEKDENYALELRAGCLSFLRARLRRQFSAIAIS